MRTPDVVRALQSASELPPEALDDLRDLLLLQREIQAHRRAPAAYEAPRAWELHPSLVDGMQTDPWPIINDVRKDAEKVVTTAQRFGMGMDDDRKGYEAGRAFVPALTDRMHLTAVIAKCADFCARAEAFVKNTLAQLRGDERIPLPSHTQLWPQNAEAAVIRNEQNLGLRAPEVAKTVQREAKPEIEVEEETPVRSKHRSRDLDF